MHCACVIWDRCVKYRKLPFTGIAAANLFFFCQDLTQTYHVRVIGGSKLTLGVNGCLFYMLAWRLVQRAPPHLQGDRSTAINELSSSNYICTVWN